MADLTFEHFGIPLAHQKVVPGDTITSLSEYCYRYRCYRLNFDDADAEIAVGDWVVEAGVGARAAARVRYVYSTAWTDGTGYLIYDSWNGTAWTNNAEIKVAAGATMANVDQVLPVVEATDAEYDLAGTLVYKGLEAKYALVVCTGNTALISMTGAKPDQTALIGTPFVANASLALKSFDAIKNFKCVDYASGSASILQVDFCF